MNRIFFSFLLFFSFSVQLFAKDDGPTVIILSEPSSHLEHYLPADIPEVFLDIDGMEIIIVADGFSSYYDVLIIRNSTNQTMISTQIDGYGDSIDISSLPSDSYIIVITSEYNNVFQGQFTII